jgi:hypothetical protein
VDRREFLLSSSTIAVLGERAAWADRTGAPEHLLTVGDDRMRLLVGWGAAGLREMACVAGEAKFDLGASLPWAVETEGGQIAPRTGRLRLAGAAATGTVRRADFEGDVDGFAWQLRYEVTVPGCITKSLTLTPRQPTVLKKVTIWSARLRQAAIVARTPLQDIGAFYRDGAQGLFVSLDFPYSNIADVNGFTEVSYPPHEAVTAGAAYVAHPLTMGSVRLAGRSRYGFDEGEIAAFDTYIQQRVPPRFERPMFVFCGLINRYTQNEGDQVFYTWKDNPTLCFNVDLVKEDLKLMPKLGMEYCQVMPGVFDWVPEDPSPELVEELMGVARANGLRFGDYSSSNYLFCPHYNDYRNRLDRPEWLIVDKDGKKESVTWSSGPFCFGSRAFVDFYIDKVVSNCRRYGFEIHCLDFLTLKPCYATDHGHPPGQDSIYHQTNGVVRLLEAINAVSPQMMSWSNSGDWSDLLPKLAWSNPNLYLTDPYIATPWQGLNMTRLLDDSRREQMVSLHNSRFIPYRFFTNFQYFFSMNSAVPDIRNFEFGALSTLAVTPNLGLGELRTWLDRLSPVDRERVIQFYQRWTGFIRSNFELWKSTFQAGDNPGPGGVEIYGHASGDHGFVFLINPNYWDRWVNLPLDTTLGFTASGQCEIAEVYPTERLRLTSQGPFADFGSRLPWRVPAQQVVVLEVRPAPKTINAPRLYGLSGTVTPHESGYSLQTVGPQGRTERAAILLPRGSTKITTAHVLDFPKQPKRRCYETPLKLLARNEEGTLLEVTYRRALAPTELRDWRAQQADLAKGLEANWPASFPDGPQLRFPLFTDLQDRDFEQPLSEARADQLGLGPLANFCGAYIDNAFSEMQPTWIELGTGGNSLPNGQLVGDETVSPRRPLHPLAKDPRTAWWVQTVFRLPFMYTLGSEPFFDEHTMLILPFVRRAHVKKISVWVNGASAEVQSFRYPRNRELGCYYVDLVGTGAKGASAGAENTLICHFQC